MKKIFTTIITLSTTATLIFAQPTPQPPNASFETWTGTGSSMEPTDYNSNKTGTGFATFGGQTCFQDASIVHSGTYSARIETISAIGSAVNGSLTSGIVNAPSTDKAEGYIGTRQGASGTDIRRIAFDGRPDSLVGWYQYVQSTSTSGGANEIGKVYAILHLGHYYDPATPVNGNHPDLSTNKIGEALFNTPAANQTTWTRFSVPFNYVSSATPEYILLNCTGSNNQMTTVVGSKLWLDDIGVVYNTHVGITNPKTTDETIKVYAFDKTFYVDFMVRSYDHSTISIYDVTGKLVSKQQLSNNKLNTINVSELTSGLYLYDLTGEDFHKTGKVIIK